MSAITAEQYYATVALEHVRGETLTSPMLPEFALSLDELFKR